MITLDVFPCRVELPDGTTADDCRTLADSNGRAAIWQADQHRPLIIWTGQITETRSDPHGRRHLDTLDGHTVTLTATGGCGCGSPLRMISETDLATASLPA